MRLLKINNEMRSIFDLRLISSVDSSGKFVIALVDFQDRFPRYFRGTLREPCFLLCSSSGSPGF
jgi:hypothetical protein